ncbi:hypothetical protein KFE25_007533 [Diacronema lutheri]|uniref:Histone chaperone RTT106/FACT complex subunit SPT16-like middle domain-containing protein n=1 Tax=Diacronema lutheri TaxID=2081491 RepID=A0A8J5Y0H8_DIALT|nr:hypothetical protein KFE25_007533 [Diacronema lutheri]
MEVLELQEKNEALVKALDRANARIHELEAALAVHAPSPAAAAASDAPTPAAPGAPHLGPLVCAVGELSMTSPRGKAEIFVHAGGIRIKAKTFSLCVPVAALLRAIELDLSGAGAESAAAKLTCLLQLDPAAVQAVGAAPKGAIEFCSWSRKRTDPDLRARLADAHLGPSWLTSTPFRADGGKPFVPGYVKATEVQIVPLDTHLLVLGRPTLCVSYDLADVSLPETVNGRKTFDMAVSFASGSGGPGARVELSMLPTSAHAALFDFIATRKRAGGAKRKRDAGMGLPATSDDPVDGEGDEGDEEDEDEEEEDDEDFAPREDSDSCAEEFDSDGGEPIAEDGGEDEDEEEEDVEGEEDAEEESGADVKSKAGHEDEAGQGAAG